MLLSLSLSLSLSLLSIHIGTRPHARFFLHRPKLEDPTLRDPFAESLAIRFNFGALIRRETNGVIRPGVAKDIPSGKTFENHFGELEVFGPNTRFFGHQHH